MKKGLLILYSGPSAVGKDTLLKEILNDAIKTIKTCIFGVVNMLELAVKNNAKIMQASTSEIYGDPLEHP